MPRALPIFVVLLSVVVAFAAGLRRELSAVHTPLPNAPSPNQPVVPLLLHPPFHGPATLLATVDHHQPRVAGTPDRVMVRADGRYSLHSPLDGSTMTRWALPEGTQIRAPLGGTATDVRRRSGWRCGEHEDGAWEVTLRSCSQEPCLILVLSPLHAPAVAAGDPVVADQPVAIAGIPGCDATTFGLMVVHEPSGALLDPYGWHAAGASPLGRRAGPIANAWLWRDGAAPARELSR